MSTSEIEYEGRRFARTGEVRKPKSGEFYLSPSSGNPHMAKMDFKFCAHELLRELPAETPARHGKDCPKVEHVGGGWLHGVDDDSPYDVDGVSYCGRCHGWMGNPAASGRGTPATRNAPDTASGLLAEAEEALAKLLRITSPSKWPETVNHAEIVLARIRAAKEKP